MLLTKLRMYGCSQNVLNWFESYLSNRKQRTKFNQYVSDEVQCELGVPQGSVLSCFLFLIFINDIKSSLIDIKIKPFADDALILNAMI